MGGGGGGGGGGGKKILNQEILDSDKKCLTGKLSRLINSLNGFYDDIYIKISDYE